MTILDCCFVDVEHSKTNVVTGTYTVRYRAETSVPYSPNDLIADLQTAGCIDLIGAAYPGLSGDLISARSAISTPDGASILSSINVGRWREIGGGEGAETKRLRYTVTLNYAPVEGEDPPPPPPGETSQDPRDWCPLYRERSVPRVVEAQKAIFRGLYDNSQFAQDCTIEWCDCPDFGGDIDLLPIAPIVTDGGEAGPIIPYRIELDDCTTPINTAGDRITGITKRVSDLEVTVTRWFGVQDASFDPVDARCKRDSLNEGLVVLTEECWGPLPVCLINPETGLLGMDWVMQTTNLPNFGIFRYWEVNYQILVRECGWETDILNEGLNRLAEVGGEDGHGGIIVAPPDGARAPTVRITERDDKGQTVSRPVPLDLNGQPIQTRDPDDTYYARWLPQGIQDWTSIGLF